MSRRLFVGIVAFAAMLFVFAQPAAAQHRVALVIGNAAYQKGPIAASLTDGGLVAEALTSVGFEIVEGADVNQSDLRRLFRDFLEKVQAGGPDTIAFIYYSGYALQFEGDNYLIPVDARLERDSDIPIDGIRLFDLLRPLADAQAAAKIVILDAARPLPFQIQGAPLSRGLGAIEAAPGLLVAFSSGPGTTVQDGQGPYGAYATAIAEMVREPGLDLDTMFARIRLRTNQASNGVQTPWDVSQLRQVVMLVPGAPSAPPPGTPQGLIAVPQAAPGAPVARRQPRPVRDFSPEDAYAYAVEQDELPTYVEYVQTYPDSPYAARIWATIRARREALLWRRALLENSPEAYWTYLQRYPEGMYVFDARRRLRRLAVAEMPPPGFRMLEFADVPPPLAGEPARLYDVYPAAPPPPRRYLPPAPAFVVGLPPAQRPGGGLWRRPETFPVVIPPRAPQGFQKGPVIVNQPPAARPGGGAPGGGAPQGFKGPQGFPQKGPAVVNQPPQGFKGPPPGFKGAPPMHKGPVIVNQPPPGPPQGFRGPPPGARVVNQPPPGGGPGGGAPGFKGPPPNFQKTPVIVNQPRLPVAAAPPAPPPPRAPAPPGPPLQAQKQFGGGAPGGAPGPRGGPPAGAGQKKCVLVNGQPVCK